MMGAAAPMGRRSADASASRASSPRRPSADLSAALRTGGRIGSRVRLGKPETQHGC